MSHNAKRALWTVLIATIAAASNLGCEGDPEARWEAFKEHSTRVLDDGTEIYVVEWDVPVASLDDLREYFDTWINHGTAHSTDPLRVAQFNGGDDIWDPTTAMNLSYCVTDDFGTDQSRAISEIRTAMDDWETLVNVRFVYDASQNGNCSNTNNSILFPVRPSNTGGACAFHPQSDDGCVSRTVIIDYNAFDTDPIYVTSAPNMSTTGVFRHELGHVLGFRHEQNGQSNNPCFEDSNWRALTPYDPGSVMHYPWCNGVTTRDMILTDFDLDGAIGLYGLAADLVTTNTTLL